MIEKDIGIGRIVITDADFGPVVVGNPDFAKRFEKAGYGQPDISWMEQKHTAQVAYVDADMNSGHVFPATDGQWTNQAGKLLVTKTADCVPILLWSASQGVVAALHSGWRGFVGGIIEAFVQQVKAEGYQPELFSAFLGPHLRFTSFEVQQDFVDALAPDKAHLVREHEGSQHFDISQGVLETLAAAGIEEVEDCGIDTLKSPEFYSYRGWGRLPENSRPESYSTFANTILLY